MSDNDRTIADAAVRAIKMLGKPSTIDDIFSKIKEERLYFFNTPTPKHVLRTVIRRHTRNAERVDSSANTLFDMVEHETYILTQLDPQMLKNGPPTGIKRIHRSADKEEFIRAITGDNIGVFKEIWKLMIFAAQVGFSDNRREPLKAIDAGKGIDQSTFGNCASWPGIIYLMSLAETQKSDCLSGGQDGEESRLAIFQEYANGGLSKMQEFFRDRPMDLDGVVAFIESETAKGGSVPDLDLSI
jgi:dnd system-associated protein 4